MTDNPELALIGCLLEKPELVGDLKSHWFDDGRAELACDATAKMVSHSQPVNLITLSSHLKFPDSKAFLLLCSASCPSLENFTYWKELLFAAYRKRELATAAQSFIARLAVANGNLPDLIATLEASLSNPEIDQCSVIAPKRAAASLLSHLEERFNLAGKTSGLATGYAAIDRITDGLQFGEMTVIGARPSIGKTALALNFVENICLKARIPTLIISLEMSANALLRRLLSSYQKIGLKHLRSGNLFPDDFPKIQAFQKLVAESPLFIQENLSGISGAEICLLVRRMVKRHGVKLVVVDYLQKLRADHKHEKRTYEVGESSGLLKGVAHQTGVAMLAIAQLNRESEKDKGRLPRASDLADSGQIERDADNILLLHRNRTENEHESKLIIAKQRDGETGLVYLYFNGEFCRFENSTNQEPDETKQPHND